MAQKLGFFIRTINSTVFKIVRRFAWAYLLSGFDIGFVRVSEYTHIHDKLYGEKNDVVQYLNRLHIGLFGMRASFHTEDLD